jgi:N-sulfoglucosamine sulfohydrolase
MRLLIFLAAIACSLAQFAAEPRPNILFCIADDWAYPHASAYGDKVVRTPAFDRVAREGMLFTHAFSAAPSCTPSRAALLTGRYPHQLEEGSVLWGFLPKKFAVYPDLLEKAGYEVGSMRKGWGPGDFRAGGFERNPAGPAFPNFTAFLKNVPTNTPFCFWFGSSDPHRPYEKGSGAAAGLNPENVSVPPYFPDNDTTRHDILDYYAEVERFDREVGDALALLEKAGQLDNTLVIITGDNGSPFPRCKANVYDGGSRQPLAIRWPAKIKPNRRSNALVNLADIAPTVLQAAGVQHPEHLPTKSFLGLLTGSEQASARNAVFLERERHANVRPSKEGYPIRAIRTHDFLYIRNFRPNRWPAGDPKPYSDPPRAFGDCDDGPTKAYMLSHRDEPAIKPLFELAFGKRPAEELYDLRNDPHQMTNLAARAELAAAKTDLRKQLDEWMHSTADPRSVKDDDRWDAYPYFGGRRVAPPGN